MLRTARLLYSVMPISLSKDRDAPSGDSTPDRASSTRAGAARGWPPPAGDPRERLEAWIPVRISRETPGNRPGRGASHRLGPRQPRDPASQQGGRGGTEADEGKRSHEPPMIPEAIRRRYPLPGGRR
jgi:hypothetical protein